MKDIAIELVTDIWMLFLQLLYISLLEITTAASTNSRPTTIIGSLVTDAIHGYHEIK